MRIETPIEAVSHYLQVKHMPQTANVEFNQLKESSRSHGVYSPLYLKDWNRKKVKTICAGFVPLCMSKKLFVTEKQRVSSFPGEVWDMNYESWFFAIQESVVKQLEVSFNIWMTEIQKDREAGYQECLYLWSPFMPSTFFSSIISRIMFSDWELVFYVMSTSPW